MFLRILNKYIIYFVLYKTTGENETMLLGVVYSNNLVGCG